MATDRGITSVGYGNFGNTKMQEMCVLYVFMWWVVSGESVGLYLLCGFSLNGNGRLILLSSILEVVFLWDNNVVSCYCNSNSRFGFKRLWSNLERYWHWWAVKPCWVPWWLVWVLATSKYIQVSTHVEKLWRIINVMWNTVTFEIMLCLEGKSNFMQIIFQIWRWDFELDSGQASQHQQKYVYFDVYMFGFNTSGMWIIASLCQPMVNSISLIFDGILYVKTRLWLFKPQPISPKAWTFWSPLGDILVSPLERACNALLLILGQLFVAKVEWIRGGNDGIGAFCLVGFGAKWLWGRSRDCVTLFWVNSLWHHRFLDINGWFSSGVLRNLPQRFLKLGGRMKTWQYLAATYLSRHHYNHYT